MMTDKKRINDKQKILSYLIRKGRACNTYNVARELDIERNEVLGLLRELAREGRVRLSHGSVSAITEELSKEDQVKTKSEVEVLKERVEKLEKVLEFAFSQLKEAIQMGHQKIMKRKKVNDESEEDSVHQEE